MGSTVTQLACGRQHCLAFVPSRGRVYSFGLGSTGQLGVRKATNASTPQVVLGPWVSPSGAPVVAASNSKENYVIYRIFAGGNQCFVTVNRKEKKITPYDCRELQPTTQILVLNYEYINSCLKVSQKAKVDHEFLNYVETVFRSLASINGSFLLANEEHYYCTSKHHGVDLHEAEKTFSLIAKTEHSSIKELVSDKSAVKIW